MGRTATNADARAPKRRSNGEGTVFEDTTRGGWIGMLYVDGKRRKVRARTKTDVLARMNLLRTAEANGTVVDGNARLGQVLTRWKERELAGRELSSSARSRHEWAVRMLDIELGTKRLRRLDVQAIEDALDRIATGVHGRGKPLGKSSIGRVRDTLVEVLDFGMRRKMIGSNPARLAVLPPTAPAPKKAQALDPAEAEALWGALDDERLGAMWRVMLTTGIRPGEALGLCWDAVDLDVGELTAS